MTRYTGKDYECEYCGRDTFLYDGYVTVTIDDRMVRMHPQCFEFYKKDKKKITFCPDEE